MLYLVNWADAETGRMIKEGAEIKEAKSIYDAKSKFLRAHWDTVRRPMAEAITMVKAKCLEDQRFAFPLSKKSFKQAEHAYDELRLAGVDL